MARRRASAAPAAPQGKARPRPQQQQQSARRPRAQKKQSRPRATGALWHPALTTLTWVPKALRLTPTIRIRDVANKTVQTGATGVTMLFGPFGGVTVPSDYLSVSQVGRASGDAGVPGVSGESFWIPKNVNSVPGGTQGRLHRIGVTIMCTGSSTNNPTSYVTYGTARNIIDSTDFATYAGVRDFIEGRAEMKSCSGMTLLRKPLYLASHPLDWTSWGQLTPIINVGATGTQAADDTFCTICITLAPTGANVDTFQVQVHTEWDMLIADDATGAALLASAHALHPVMPERRYEEEAAGLFSVGGVVAALKFGATEALPVVEEFGPALGLL